MRPPMPEPVVDFQRAVAFHECYEQHSSSLDYELLRRLIGASTVTQTERLLHDGLFDGPGEVRALCRSLDWGATSLGPVETWSQSLRLVTRLCLESKTPTALWIGNELALIHNDAYAVVLGAKYPSGMGRPLREVWSEVWDQIAEEFSRVLTQGESVRHQQTRFRLRREGRDEVGYFSYSLTPLRDIDNRVVGVFSVMEETTPVMMRYEEQVRLFESVTSTTPDFVYVFNRQGCFVYANRRLLEVWGMQLPEVLGKTCRELGYEQWHHDMHMREIAEVIETKQAIKGEVPFEAPRTGIAGIYEYIFTPVIGATGEVELIAGTTRDVTDRKRTEQALRESEERLRALVSASSDAVYRMNPDWREMHQLEGRRFLANTDAATGTWLDKYIPDEDKSSVRAAIQEAIHTKRVFQLEHRVLRADGNIGWTLSRAVPLLDSGGNLVEWVGAASDITERKQDQLALEHANAQLREANEQKNHFLAVLSHELRNPLMPIKNSLYILDRAVPGGNQARRAKDVIERQIDQLSHLVDDLLDITRITRGRVQLHRRRLELNDLVRRTIDDHRALFQASEVELDVQPAPQLLFINADWNRTAQVLSNLLQNSAKFTPRGGRVLVTLECDTQAEQAVIRVLDTGLGMDSALVSRLFEPFMQADETLDRSRGGLGLGLALVKGIVEQHGGSVDGRSHGIGRGSEFVVRLPLDHSAPPQSERPSAPEVTDCHRVLIIEDNIDAAESLKEVLALHGHEVAVAYDGHQGIAKAREFRPALVLCDIGLPGIDGYDVARAFRADDLLRDVHLVALSGYALPEDLQRAAEAGFEQHLAKPPSFGKLQTMLDKFCPRAPISASSHSCARK